MQECARTCFRGPQNLTLKAVLQYEREQHGIRSFRVRGGRLRGFAARCRQVDPRLPHRHHHPVGHPGGFVRTLLQHPPSADARQPAAAGRARFDSERSRASDDRFRQPPDYERHHFRQSQFRARARRFADGAAQEGAFVEPGQNQAVREGGRDPADHHARLYQADRFAQYAQQAAYRGECFVPQGDFVRQPPRRHGRGEGRRAQQQGARRVGHPGPRHPAHGAQRP